MNDLTAEEWKMTKTRAKHVTIFSKMILWHAPNKMCWNHQISKIGRPQFPSNRLKDRHARVMSQSCSTETSRVTLTFENVSVRTITKISKWPSKGFCVKNVRFISFKNVWYFIAYLIFVIFFTRAKFLDNKIYTEKRQSVKKTPLFRVESVENANFSH